MAQYAQYFYGHDSDLQSMKECVTHGLPCEYYKRSSE